MPFVRSDNARIFWEAEGSGTPVLLIMGHLYSSRMWYPLMPALAARHRVIRFDNRGTGQSDTTDGVTIEQMAADARAVLDAAGAETAHVYGVSMGGGIAAELGMAYPERVRSLTLGCTMLKTTAGKRERGRAGWIYRLPLWLVRQLLRRTTTPERYGSAAPRDLAERDIAALAEDRFTMRGVRQQSVAINAYATTKERAAERLTMPVLVLHGDEDETVPVEHGRALAQAIPGSRYIEFKGAAHNYLVATRDASTAAFMDFIDDVDRDADRDA
jgi:3-oxoadipate enol-lactonase